MHKILLILGYFLITFTLLSLRGQQNKLYRLENIDFLNQKTQENLELRKYFDAQVNRLQDDNYKIVSLNNVKSLSSINIQNLKDFSEILIPLNNDLQVLALNKKLIMRSDSDYTWIGEIDGDKLSSVLLTVKNGHIAGEIRQGNHHYSLIPLSKNMNLLVNEIGHSVHCELDNKMRHLKIDQNLERVNADTNATQGEFIDMMVLYTDDAALNMSSIETVIENTIDAMNVSLAKSCASTRLRLVHTQQVTMTESSSQEMIAHLTDTTDGVLDTEATTLRSTHGADLISLWTFNNAAIGSMPPLGNQDSGYFASVISPFGGLINFTFLHEVGHNLGIDHDRYSEDQGNYDYGHAREAGFAYVDTTNNFSTNVARGGSCGESGHLCFLSGLFSNPRILKNGAPAGIAGIADAVSVINYNSSGIAGYSQSTTDHSPDLSGCLETNSVAPSSTNCFIATASFGSYLHPYVYDLRKFRDQFLLSHPLGKKVVDFYYAVSPPVADFIASNDLLKLLTRVLLSPIITFIKWPWWNIGVIFSFLCSILFFKKAVRG